MGLGGAIGAFASQEYVKLMLRSDPTSYFSQPPVEVNARDLIGDIWATHVGHQVFLSFYAQGKAGAYPAAAAILGRPSWIAMAGHLAFRLAQFERAEYGAGDLLRPACQGCGLVIPAGLLGELWSPDWCPRCADEHRGLVTGGLVRTLPV